MIVVLKLGLIFVIIRYESWIFESNPSEFLISKSSKLTHWKRLATICYPMNQLNL